MNKFEAYLRNVRELHYIDRKKYVKLTDTLKYLGYETIENISVEVLFFNGEIYISLEKSELLITTTYNKNNPKVVQYHKDMGFINLEYTVTAKALNPVVNTFDKVGTVFKTMGANIESKFGLMSGPETKSETSMFQMF